MELQYHQNKIINIENYIEIIFTFGKKEEKIPINGIF